MPAKKHTQEETPRAAAAKERYATMPQPRSLQRLADTLVAEQQAELRIWQEQRLQAQSALQAGAKGEYAARLREALARPAPKVQHVGVVLRRLKEWSAAFGWQQYVTDADLQATRQQQAERQAAVQRMNDTQTGLAREYIGMATKRAADMIRVDAARLADWEVVTGALRAQAKAAQEAGDLATYVDLLSRVGPPPKPYFGAYSLVQLLGLGLDVQRTGTEAATLAQSEAGLAALPSVVEITMATTPPPEPADEAEYVAAPVGLPPELQAADSAAQPGHAAGQPTMPTPLVGFATQPPPAPEEDEDDWRDLKPF